MLLHWHSKLDHMRFKQLRDLVVKVYIPKTCTRFKEVKCPACQQDKDTFSKTHKKNKIVKESIVKYPGDLICMV